MGTLCSRGNIQKPFVFGIILSVFSLSVLLFRWRHALLVQSSNNVLELC